MAELAYENSRQPPQGSLTLHGRMAWTLALTVGTSIVEIIGGLWTGSLALLILLTFILAVALGESHLVAGRLRIVGDEEG